MRDARQRKRSASLSTLEEVIRGKIEKGIWSPGQLIPSEMDLIKEYGISRTTVREALGVWLLRVFFNGNKEEAPLYLSQSSNTL